MYCSKDRVRTAVAAKGPINRNAQAKIYARIIIQASIATWRRLKFFWLSLINSCHLIFSLYLSYNRCNIIAIKS